MTLDIKDIFSSITPENIRNVPVVKDAMNIFIETLQELSKESIDIRNAYSNQSIREELVKIYLDDLYRVFEALKLNQKVVDKIEQMNSIYGTDYYKKDAILNIINYINEEHFLAFKSYKEKKGTVAGIKYIYDLVGTKIMNENAQMPFTLTETLDVNGNKVPFNFSIQGSLPRELYEAIVSPLANPLGFLYVYDQIISQVLEDIFLSAKIYVVNMLEVRCLLPDGTTATTDFAFNNGVARVVTDITTVVDGQSRTKNIIFDDGTYLSQTTTLAGQTSVVYLAADNTTVLWSSPYQCSVYINYTYELKTGVIEEFSTINKPAPTDYVSRLDPNNNNLPAIDVGFNALYDVDGNRLFGADINVKGRQENYFAPSDIANMKLLEGKYQKDVNIYDPGTGDFVEVQHIKYTDVIDPALKVVERTNSETAYTNQNIGNEDRFAQEHYFDNSIVVASHNEQKIEYTDYHPWYVIGQDNFNIGDVDQWGVYYAINNDFWPYWSLGMDTSGGANIGEGFYIGYDYNYRYTNINRSHTQSNHVNTVGDVLNPIVIGLTAEVIGINYTYTIPSEPRRALRTEITESEAINISTQTFDVMLNATSDSISDSVDLQLNTNDGPDIPSSDTIDSFSFGVYRNNVLLLDNNVSSWI